MIVARCGVDVVGGGGGHTLLHRFPLPQLRPQTPLVRVLLLEAINLTGCRLVLFRDPINCRQQNTQSRRKRVISSVTHLVALFRPWDQHSIVSSESLSKYLDVSVELRLFFRLECAKITLAVFWAMLYRLFGVYPEPIFSLSLRSSPLF